MNNPPTIVSSQWLSEHLDDPSLVIVDCRFQLADASWGEGQYRTHHIRGAYFLDLNQDLAAPVTQYGGRHPLPNPAHLAEKLGSIGIGSGQTWVVAYDDARFAFASRLWWLLRYLGHERVSLLDGGWNAWKAAGYPISDRLPTPTPTIFVPQIQTHRIVDYSEVRAKQNSPSVVLIDARDGDRFLGEREPIDPVAGHIAGAVNSPWGKVTDGQGYLYPLEDQQRLWDNYQTAEELIIYCGSGVTACVNLLSLALIGRENVKLYPGGWSDWCSHLQDRT